MKFEKLGKKNFRAYNKERFGGYIGNVVSNDDITKKKAKPTHKLHIARTQMLVHKC